MALVEIVEQDGAVWLWLNRPERHNALVQPLLDELRAGIATAAKISPVALVLCGRGPSFSTGGDIAGFVKAANSKDRLYSHSEQLVGTLHDAIIDLLEFPSPVIAGVNGPLTGGSTGLMLAADLVAMADHAFIQPYYSEVGFGPDGGWTALLPDRIGTGRALEVQYLNQRIGAEEAKRLGLASCVCPASELQNRINTWIVDLAKRFAQTHRATRSNIWDEERIANVRRRLDQEKACFLDLIVQPETWHGMTSFIEKRA